MPYDNHGDEDNLVEAQFEKAGTAADIDKVKAKENMLELLNIEKEKNQIETPKENYGEE